MKKNFLKIIFAMTIGVSIIAGNTKAFSSNATDSNNILPSGYTEIPYVNFVRNSYLDTGIIFDTDTFEVSFNYSGSLPNYSFGYEKSSRVFALISGVLYLGTWNHTSLGSNLNTYRNSKTLFNVSCSNNVINLTAGEEEFTSPLKHTGITDIPFHFGKTNNSAQKEWFKGKLYDFSIKLDNQLVFNGTPCIQQSSNKIGFYDFVSSSFLSSSGESEFVYDCGIEIKYQESGAATVVNVQDETLYLPSSTDFSNMGNNLIVDQGTELTGTIAEQKITVGSGNIDLSTIFGNNMTSGTFYPLTLTKNGFSRIITIIKSGETPSLYLNCNLDYTTLTSSKLNNASGNLKFVDGEYEKTAAIVNFKGRGNSFYYNSKDSFSLKLNQEEQEEDPVIFISGVTTYKYNLIGLNSHEVSYITNQSAYYLYQKLCTNGDAINFRMINLYYNSTCIGLYMLTEKVTISENVINITSPTMTEGSGQSKNVNSLAEAEEGLETEIIQSGIQKFKYVPSSEVQHDGGFVIEAGYYYDSAKSGFVTRNGNYWEVKEPEALTLSQIHKLAIRVQEAEDALYSSTGVAHNKHYNEFYDLDSIAREFIIRAYAGDKDIYVTSNYLYIDGNDDGFGNNKFYAGPVWDFDYITYDSSLFFSNTVPKSAQGFLKTLISKGDFMYNVYNVNKCEFDSIIKKFTDITNTESQTIYDFRDDYLSERTVDDNIWYRRSNGSIWGANYYANQIASRYNSWSELWSDTTNNIRGVVINNVGGTLTATAKGATSYQWFKINNLGVAEEAPNSEDSPTYVPTTAGSYYVVVEGNAMLGTTATEMPSNVITTNQSSLQYNMLGHGTQVQGQKLTNGSRIAMPKTPYEEGYVFKGWYKEPACTNRWNFANDVINADTILYAKWVQDGTLFAGSTLSLCDNTWLNTYTELVDDDCEQYTFKYKIRDGVITDLPSNLFNKVNGRYRLSVILLPYQLADNVTFYMYDLDGHLICTKVDSVRSYAKRLIASPSISQEEKNAVLALLDYGAAVQIFKGYNTGDLANDLSKAP